MKRTKKSLLLWITMVLLLLLSGSACASSKQEPYIPEEYLDWTVVEASVTMIGSEIVKSNIVVTLEGTSIQLDYENGERKECETISRKSSLLSGGDLIEFLETSSEAFQEITQSDTVRIGITGSTEIFEAMDLGEEIYLYSMDTKRLLKTSYDDAGGIAWGSIMDGDYKQVYIVILR